jgi:hypothetical protein
MAAGLGFKDFQTGEVLTAADVDGYLMQNIWVFASNAARDAAVTSPSEGNFAFTKDTNSLWYYDGAAWVASGATGDIEGVTAGIGISGGGTSGTVTVTNSMATAIDAKGDLVAGTGADTFAKLTVGANDTVLTADSTTATGLKWATPAAAGGMTLISETVASGLSSLSFSSLGSYKQLLLVWSGIQHNTTGSQFSVRLNNSSSTIYDFIGIKFTQNSGSAAPTGGNATAMTGAIFGQNATGTVNNVVIGELLIDNYTSSTKFKTCLYNVSYQFNSGDGATYQQYNSIFSSTTAVTSIDIVRLTGSATFSNVSDTSIRLYGIS